MAPSPNSETGPQSSEERLEESAVAIEKHLETPVVPGEMRGWANRAKDGLEELASEFATHVKTSHQRQFDEILEQDAGLSARVEKLRDEDMAIGEAIENLVGSFSTLALHVAAVEEDAQRDEAELADDLPPLTGDALALIIRIRMQESALRTWYVEAFQRDRGVVD